MKKKNIKIKSDWDNIEGIPFTESGCKEPVLLRIFDETVKIGWFASFNHKMNMLTNGLSTVFNSKMGLNYEIDQSYLTDLEKLAQWYVDNKHTLDSKKEFQVEWITNRIFVKGLLDIISIIKSNLRVVGNSKCFYFPTVAHFKMFGYYACRISGGVGYDFREASHCFPISFDRFKQMQSISKLMVDSAISMDMTYKEAKKEEIDKWLC